MAQDPNQVENNNNPPSQSSNLQATLDRIDAMESDFQTLKDGFEDNIDKIKEAIQKASKAEQTTSDKPTNTARADADCKEFFDDEKTLKLKIKKLSELIKKSKHFVAFTGAGISTSAGIADFRSGRNTVLNTGTGKWAKEDAIRKGKQFNAGKKKINTFKAIPTPSHMALVQLMQCGYLKYLISQNTDGLHRRSGIPIHNISELHGNRTLEVCDKCAKGYIRDYCCRNSLRKQKVHDHKTGRYCTVPACGGHLCDTIINFGEALPSEPLDKARDNGKVCDLMLSLGSSLTVTPAADIPDSVGDKWEKEKNGNKEIVHNLVIVNLQQTPLDLVCSLRIFAQIDKVMIGVMKELELTIPKWNLQKFLKLKMEDIGNRNDLKKLSCSGVDIDGVNATVFTEVKLMNNGHRILKMNSHSKKKYVADEYVFNVPKILQIKEDKGLMVELTFYGHYGEPKLLIQLNDYLTHLGNNNGEIVLKLVYNLSLKQWIVQGKEHQMKDKDIGKLWIVEKNNDDVISK